MFVKLPKGATAAQAPAGFVALTQAQRVPVGSQLDTVLGAVRVTSATTTPGRTQSGQFQGGVFEVLQNPAAGGLTELRLASSTRKCPAAGKAGRAAVSSRILQLLHATAHGTFRITGRYSSGTVRGTQWDEIDRCDGTLTVVHKGTVAVSDFHRHTTVVVHAGHRYLARAR